MEGQIISASMMYVSWLRKHRAEEAVTCRIELQKARFNLGLLRRGAVGLKVKMVMNRGFASDRPFVFPARQ